MNAVDARPEYLRGDVVVLMSGEPLRLAEDRKFAYPPMHHVRQAVFDLFRQVFIKGLRQQDLLRWVRPEMLSQDPAAAERLLGRLYLHTATAPFTNTVPPLPAIVAMFEDIVAGLRVPQPRPMEVTAAEADALYRILFGEERPRLAEAAR